MARTRNQRAAVHCTVRPGRPGRTKTATLIARTIVREIHRRGLVPGDKLISEQKMVERYGVARGSLREALRFLELQGVLKIKTGPGGGPVVDAPHAQHLASTLALLLQFVGAPFRSIIETRLVVEPGMTVLAAQRAGADDLAALQASLDVLRDGVEDEASFHEEHRHFHDLIAFASHNPVFRFLLPALHWISDGAGMVYGLPERRTVAGAMEQIYEAIEQQDGDGAALAMRRFFEGSLAYLDRVYPQIMETGVTWADLDL